MIIKENILDKISKISNSNDSEIGGILGSSKNEIITDMIEDIPVETESFRFEYHPNISLLNKKIEEWAENNIVFSGIFHTHFSGAHMLSDVDTEYIKALMNNVRGVIDYLYFPVFTMPDNKLNVYKAYFLSDKIIIDKDELSVV